MSSAICSMQTMFAGGLSAIMAAHLYTQRVSQGSGGGREGWEEGNRWNGGGMEGGEWWDTGNTFLSVPSTVNYGSNLVCN